MNEPGKRGWLAVIAIVILAEMLDERTLSDSFLELSRGRKGRVLIGPAWLILTLHLFGVLPPRYDPLHQFAKRTFARGRENWRYTRGVG